MLALLLLRFILMVLITIYYYHLLLSFIIAVVCSLFSLCSATRLLACVVLPPRCTRPACLPSPSTRSQPTCPVRQLISADVCALFVGDGYFSGL